MKHDKPQRFLSRIIHRVFKKGKGKLSRDILTLRASASREPANGFLRLRIAERYQQLGEKQNAIAEYLKAAELFCNIGYYHRGAAIYKKILKEGPDLELVKIRLADTYKKMGFLAQAFAVYHRLYCSYKCAGAEDKALEIIGFMAELDPQKFSLGERANLESQAVEKARGLEPTENIKENNLDRLSEEGNSFFDLNATLETNDPMDLGETKAITMEETFGAEKIITELNETWEVEKLFLNYNYQMGLICKELGLIGEAIKQFQKALARGQKSNQATKLLDLCLREKEQVDRCGPFTGMLQEESATAR